MFWTGEGIGIEWPGADLALLVLAVVFLATANLPRRPALEASR